MRHQIRSLVKEGDVSPLFYYQIMDNKKVLNLIEEALAQHQELFLIDYHISPSGNIELTVDGDHGISIDQCVAISRYIERRLNEDEEDFALTVTSPDITKPISHNRQYIKNIGRTLQILTETEKIEGKLTDVSEIGVQLTYLTKVPKEKGKGKITVEVQKEIPFNTIKKSTVKIVYN